MAVSIYSNGNDYFRPNYCTKILVFKQKIGCIAFGRSTDLNVDKTEIEEARWFSQNEINLILQNQHPENITIPSERTIAHQLLNYWNQTNGQIM